MSKIDPLDMDIVEITNRTRPIALMGIAGYDNAYAMPGRLGFNVGRDGWSPVIETFLRPVLDLTACRRIFLHKPFWSEKGEFRIPFLGPVILKDSLPRIYESFVDGFGNLSPHVEVIDYHGSVLDGFDQMTKDEWAKIAPGILERVFEPTRSCRHSFVFDEVSALRSHASAFISPVLLAMKAAGVRIYMEQRRGLDQPQFAAFPTFTLQSEINRQKMRGGEPSLEDFSQDVENIIGLDEPPLDRDPMEGWDAWISDECQSLRIRGFTPAVPIHSMVKRGKWDLLREIFADVGGGA